MSELLRYGVRDAHKKNRADRALWDPDHNDTGYDTFYPLHIQNTELRPWMFSVTQALREWIYDLIPRLVEAGPNITEQGTMMVVKPVKQILTQYIETEMKEINQLFSQVEIKDKKFKTPGCEDATEDDVNPIMAAFDWEKCETYDVLAERGVRILSSAFKMAFPTGNTKKDSINITGCNVERIDEFRQYISEQYNKFNNS